MAPQVDAARGLPSPADTGTAAGDQLARLLSEFARRAQAETDTGLMLDEIVRAAVALIPGVDEASISVTTGRRDVSSQHPSGRLPERVDAVQTETGQGPCLDAAYEHETVRVPDMASEERWPKFAARASALGAASMLSIQLWVENDNLGALNLYSYTPDSFTDESEHVGLLFASHAAVAFAGADKVHHLNIALARRDLIGQAKGILMERFTITADQAFNVLVRVSRDQNRKLFDVAEDLAQTGHLRQ
ncbi:GAF and ANTAR domain-containing protein [Terrabacter carboxydivorans]|uniref:GAF and ANTAR domain-containing protein n=1 Tax=Terrabacter carboxydivorans TaxID=619730 RepID=A0ABN3LDY1_9MICO